VEYNEILADEYVHVLALFLDGLKNSPIETVYIGGGTPSVLSNRQLKILLDGVSRNFDISAIKEWTVEANPESLTADKLDIMKSFGVNRLSLGLQSFSNDCLKKLGRLHTLEDFCRAYENLQKCGFDNINIDMMFGLPGESPDSFREGLKSIMSLSPAHLSFYPLTIEEGTPFYKNAIAVDEGLQAQFYDEICDALCMAGFVHYEISNWAKPGFESLHNSNYWRNKEFIGMGAGASGYESRHRYKICEDINGFIEGAVALDIKSCYVQNEYIDDRLFNVEQIILGLRLLNEGVRKNYFIDKQSILDKFLADGSLILDGDFVRLAKERVFVSNGILEEFL
jgi:oxygen-independent coproporphyrinogen-3 oxidase